MTKIYSAPKAEKVVFEAKDIITASRMLLFGGTAREEDIASINWDDFN